MTFSRNNNNNKAPLVIVVVFFCLLALLAAAFIRTTSQQHQEVTTTANAPAWLHPIQVQGYKFWDSVTGQEFVVRGIDYYPRPNTGDLNYNSIDLFTAEHRHIWQRDISYLKQLGVNAVRLYAVDGSQNHDAFMCALNAAGIYAMVALAHDCPVCAITRDAAPDCYPAQLKRQGQLTIREFSKYPNTLAFSVGNEVNHFAPPSQPEWNAPCQKKFLKDMREYVESCASASEHDDDDMNDDDDPALFRRVPIGLVSADSDREVLAAYYNCQSSSSSNAEGSSTTLEAAEWYGLNSYVSCDGNATAYQQAGGMQLLQGSFARLNYSIPVLLTEFGCLSQSFPTVNGYPGQRNFHQAQWLLSEPALREQFSGGFAFEYSLEQANAQMAFPFQQWGPQNYGIGYFSPADCDDVTVPCDYVPMPAFGNLQKTYAQVVQPQQQPPSNATTTTDTTTTDSSNSSSTGAATNRTTTTTTTIKMDHFSVPSHRQGRSACPKQFPPLDSLDWQHVDRIPNLQCVARRRTLPWQRQRRQRQAFSCPATSSSSSSSFTSSSIEVGRIQLGVVLVVMASLVVLVWRVRARRHQQQQPQILEDSHDSQSLSSSEDESVGLLSMKSLYHLGGVGGGGASYYQAIDSSDSSSSSSDEEDLEQVLVE